MTTIIIILLIIAIIYLYYQNRKLASNSEDNSSFANEPRKVIFDAEEEELIAERDSAIRERNEAQAESLATNNRLRNKQQEVNRKEAEIERLKQEASQKEIALNNKLKQNKQQHTEQLRKINLLFDPQAETYKEIDFNGLYALLEKVAKKDLPGSFPGGEND
jgi:transcriptional regulator of acetoin/glycerol metabolism